MGENKLTENEVKRLWEAEWKENDTLEKTASPIGRILREQRLKITSEMLEGLSRDLSTIDMGCGGGTTLTLLRHIGFTKSIGIDFSEAAIRRCESLGFRVGVDVFNYDAKVTPYRDREFGLVFEEGLWEHFPDPTPFIKEACRISDKWMLVIQPDHYTFFGGLLHWLWGRFNGGGVKEYSFPMQYFINQVKEHGFTLVQRRTTSLDIQSILLFRREN